MNLSKQNLFAVLDILKSIGILLLVLMFIHFNTAVARQSQATKEIAASTNSVVKSQGNILKAIKQVTIDTQLTAQQQTSIIICMLQVPIQNRTTDLQAQCRAQAISSGQATPGSSSVTAPQTPSKVFVSSPSPQSAPNTDNKQANTSPTPSLVKRAEQAGQHTVSDIIKFITP